MEIKKIRLTLILLVAFTAGVILSPLFLGTVNAYGERDGFWSATEKRQIISLLGQIADNTR